MLLEVLCQDLLSRYQLTNHFLQVRSSLHLITGDLVRAVSCRDLTHNSLSWRGSVLVNPALDLISDLLKGFGGVVSDSALYISSELGVCQVLQELVSKELVLIRYRCCIQALHPC